MSPSTPQISFHRLAAAEYVRAYRWYARRSPKAAQLFQVAMTDAIQRIASNPLSGSLLQDSFRWVRVKRFPYVLYYEFANPRSITIYAVAHGRRRPRYWLRRVGP